MFVYENGVFTAVPCTKKNSYLSIRDFAEGRDGTIYVASPSGVCRVRSGLLVPYSNPYITGETAYALGIDRYGRLWCAMSTGKCAVMQDDRVLAMLNAELFFEDGSVISCLTSDRANNIYLGTNGSALAKVACSGQRLDGTAFIVQSYEVTEAANHNRIDVTAEGDILVSGQQGFAWVTADGTQRDSHSGTSTDAVNCAALDTEGNVWLASSNEGLIRYSPGCFASPNLAAGLTDMDINAVTAAGGRYYAAVNQGLLAFDSDWQPVQNALTRALDGVPVQSLMVDSRGRLWCGTYSELGLVRYDTGSGEIVFFNQSNGLGSTRIRVAFELRDGTVAVGTQDGLALIRGDEVAAFYDKDNGLETQSILCIVQAPDGTLLAGSAGSGIYALAQDGSITKFSYEQGLEDGVVLRILQEEDGRSAFVSAGSHLYYWADGTFRRLDGLRIGPGSIFDLYERDGKLWLLQDSGIYALDKARILAGETPYATQYGTARGLTGSLRVNTCNYMAPDGSLYLATRNGVSVFDFREISAPMPPLVINSIRVDDRTYESPERLTLGSDARRMTIRFSALTYSGATDLCIGYQLVGFAKAKAYTVGSWLEVWMENYAKVKLRPSTFKTSQGFLKNHIKPQIGSIPLADLTSLDLQRFYKHLLDGGRVDRIEAKKKPKGLAPKTVRNIHQMIGSAYNLAIEQKLVGRNPTQGCALPKVEHKEMKTLTADQLSAFFQEAKDSGVYELYYLDLATGLRRGELLGLKWTDVDLDRGVLKIQRAISRQNGKVVEAPLKTKNAYRTLPLSVDAIDVLKMQKCKVGNSEWVFPSPSGGPMSPDSVLHMLQRVLKRAGLPRIRFHDLRHTFATMALQNGVDVKTVSSMLGHYSAGFTLDTYAHVTTDAQLKAAQTMGSILSRAV